MPRLFPLALLLAGALSACARPPVEAGPPPTFDAAFAQRIEAIGRSAAPGVLGVAVMDLGEGEVFAHNGLQRFPLQSVFKAVLGAAVLAEVDAGRLKLDETVTLEEEDLSPPHSPIAAAWPGRRDYTIDELLVAAVGGSDNTAADLLMARIGGPGALTGWLRNQRVEGLRIDRFERQMQPESLGLGTFRPEWRDPAAYDEARRSVPEGRQRLALMAYLADPQDTATPREMLTFLDKLADGELLSPDSTARLLRIMTETPSGARRLKAGLPPGAVIAHKTGGGWTVQGINMATNDAGLVTLPGGRRLAVVVFLSGATLGEAEREAVHADVMRAIVNASA
jgi:beta-lactamase class A